MIQHQIVVFLHLFMVLTAENQYVTYIPGELPVILSAPHGGSQVPSQFPVRDAGCWDSRKEACVWTHNCGTTDTRRCQGKTLADSRTKEFCKEISAELYELTGYHPHVVINELHRKILDANRPMDEATFGVPEMEVAWTEYQNNIYTSQALILGKGLFIDLHGQGHDTGWNELGYLITGSNLDRGNLDPAASSIKDLAGDVRVSFDELIRGENSFGGLMQKQGFPFIPSPQYPTRSGNSYFTGGYNIRQHGSKDGGLIDGIQLEAHRDFRVNTAARKRLAIGVASTIVDYMRIHYNMDLARVGVPSNAGGPYLTYLPGNMPIILSAAQGGSKKPVGSTATREAGCWDSSKSQCTWTHDCRNKDTNRCNVNKVSAFHVKDLSLEVRQELYQLTGNSPHVVINELDREYLDVNREIKEGAFGVTEMEQAWNSYHQAIEQSQSSMAKGLFLDITGHTHRSGLIELGYLLSEKYLRLTPRDSSIRSLASSSRESFTDLINGHSSFGGLLQSQGVPAIPSPGHPLRAVGCIENGKNTQGREELGETRIVDSWQNCAARCLLWKSCTHWTWYKVSERCIVMRSYLSTVSNSNAVSGSRTCQPGTVCETDMALWGFNTKVITGLSSRDVCVERCLAETEFYCLSVDFRRSDKRCTLSKESKLTEPTAHKPSDNFDYCTVERDTTYFTGGYSTQQHGSRNGGAVDAMQVATHIDYRNIRASRQAYARKLANVLISYMRIHYNIDLNRL